MRAAMSDHLSTCGFAAAPAGPGARRGLRSLGWLFLLLVLPAPLRPCLAQSSKDMEFRGQEFHDGVNGFGDDTVDLLDLGLTVTQELTPSFKVNDLAYQVMAYYTGTGTSTESNYIASSDNRSYYTYFSPGTVWGPMGAGWNVHMGKLLSTGWVELNVASKELFQRGFEEDGYACASLDMNYRHLINFVVEPTGARHPMFTNKSACTDYDNCFWSPDYSVDNSWIKAELNSDVCHGTAAWRTGDGTRYEVRPDGLVKSITDLSGNRVEISYYDNPDDPTQFPDCSNRSWCTYGVSRSKLPSVNNNLSFNDPVLRDPAWPLREIRDSHGRTIRFILSSSPIPPPPALGGKYRIERIESTSPLGTAVYTLKYAVRDVINYAESQQLGAFFIDPCGSTRSYPAMCLAPEMRNGDPVGHKIPNVPFLVQVTRPDGVTIEYDYYEWGDLKSVRTSNGGVVDYKWNFWDSPTRVKSVSREDMNRGVKLIAREVRPSATSSEIYKWGFEKNWLPEKLNFSSEDIRDQNRTIVTMPEGNEIAYRFNIFGQLRNVKTYAGKAFRYLQTVAECSKSDGSDCVSSKPDGRLMREVDRLFDQGRLQDSALADPVACLPNKCDFYQVNTRVRREDTLYLDDLVVSPQAGGCTDPNWINDYITGDWLYDVRGGAFRVACSGTSSDPRAFYSHARVERSDWQPLHGYRRTTLSGSSLGLTRTEERQYLTGTSPNEPLVCDPLTCNLSQCMSADACIVNPDHCCSCTDSANLCIAKNSPYRLYEKLWFRSPIAWVKTSQTVTEGRCSTSGVVCGSNLDCGASGGSCVLTPTVKASLVEYQYDRTQIDKVIKEIHHKDPDAVPSNWPYDPHPDGTNGDVNVIQEWWPARDPLAALPGAPDGTAYGLPKRMIRNGGDPRTTSSTATGNSGIQYEERSQYSFSTLSQRQIGDVLWKSVDATVLSSGQVQESRDTAGVTTKFTYDSMGRVVKTEPGGTGSGEYPEHEEYLNIGKGAELNFLAGMKLTGRVTWKGPDGAAYVTNSFCSYVQYDLDGLGRLSRQESKLVDGTKVEKPLSYGTPATLPDKTKRRGGWNRVTFENEWRNVYIPKKGTQPPSPLGTTEQLLFETTDSKLQGRFDPFLRYWKWTAADGAVRVMSYFGLASRVTTKGIRGAGGTLLTPDPETVLYRDSLGRLRVVDGPAGGADAVYDYGFFGDLVKANLVSQVQIVPARSPDGLLSSRFTVSNGAGQTRTFDYDALGHLKSAIQPESGMERYYAYDPAGQPLIVQDAKGTLLWNTYDMAGRLTEQAECWVGTSGVCDSSTPRNPLAQWLYDDYGYVTGRGRSLGKLINVLSYDDFGSQISLESPYYAGLNGRVSEQRLSLRDWSQPGIMGPSYQMFYTYGPLGVANDVSYPSQVGPRTLAATTGPVTIVTYNYAHGMLSSVTTNRTGISATFQYHPSSLVKTITHGNTTTTTIGADARWRVASIEAKNAGGSLWKTGTFRYDGGGNIYEIGESTFPAMDYWKFGYDAQQRLARAQMAGYTISHAYDIYGNMTEQHFLAAPTGGPPPGMEFQNRSYSESGLPSKNRIVALGFTYDANGNLTADVSGANYAYDLRNRLNAVGPLNAYGEIVPKGVYQYSASSLRVSRDDRISGTMTFYFRDLAGEVLSEFTRPSSGGTAAWTRDYVSGGGRQLAVIENKGTSGIVSSTLHPDHLGSIRLVTNASGQMISKHAYFPFGKEIPPLIASPSTHRFIGRDWDPESDLLYDQARYHCASLARFNTADPLTNLAGSISRPQRWNRYAYGLNSPLKFLDADGREAKVVGPIRSVAITGFQRSDVFRTKFLSIKNNPLVKITIRFDTDTGGKPELTRMDKVKGVWIGTVNILPAKNFPPAANITESQAGFIAHGLEHVIQKLSGRDPNSDESERGAGGAESVRLDVIRDFSDPNDDIFREEAESEIGGEQSGGNAPAQRSQEEQSPFDDSEMGGTKRPFQTKRGYIMILSNR